MHTKLDHLILQSAEWRRRKRPVVAAAPLAVRREIKRTRADAAPVEHLRKRRKRNVTVPQAADAVRENNFLFFNTDHPEDQSILRSISSRSFF